MFRKKNDNIQRVTFKDIVNYRIWKTKKKLQEGRRRGNRACLKKDWTFYNTWNIFLCNI